MFGQIAKFESYFEGEMNFGLGVIQIKTLPFCFFLLKGLYRLVVLEHQANSYLSLTSSRLFSCDFDLKLKICDVTGVTQ